MPNKLEDITGGRKDIHMFCLGLNISENAGYNETSLFQNFPSLEYGVHGRLTITTCVGSFTSPGIDTI